MARAKLSVLFLVACCVGGSSSTTWSVTVQKGGDGSTPCATPKNCSLPGALYAAQFGDTVEVLTNVVLSERITLKSLGGTGTINIKGGGHTVSSSGFGSARAIAFENWGDSQVVKFSSLTFAGFSGQKHSVICQSADETCDDTNTATPAAPAAPGRVVAEPAPFHPTLILDDVTFYNNTCPEGAVGIWDLYQVGKGKLGLLINQCTFLDNTAVAPPGGQLIYAGLLLSMSTNSRVTESLFQGNTFSASLLGMPDFSSFYTSYSQVKAWDNTFVGTPFAGNRGEGYIMRAGMSTVAIYYSTFERNKGASLGLRAHNLTMIGSFATVAATTSQGESQISTTFLALGECSLRLEDGEPFSVSTGISFNRNPAALNLTFPAGVNKGCASASQGRVGCDPSQPCTNIMDSNGDGALIGYKCAPAQ